MSFHRDLHGFLKLVNPSTSSFCKAKDQKACPVELTKICLFKRTLELEINSSHFTTCDPDKTLSNQSDKSTCSSIWSFILPMSLKVKYCEGGFEFLVTNYFSPSNQKL